MPKQNGFTLIELLLGIAVIALPMAILMPMLQRVKEQARAIGCQSNLKQWALIFPIYASDNDKKFPHKPFLEVTNKM
jgi:prepilin-type N-terminal cleavage/methylation domain-containing protein